MLDLKFGKSIGTKFNEDGSVKFFPGNTIICILDHNSEVFERARKERDLLGSIAPGCFTPLPDNSLHMTAIEGLCDKVRKPELWSSKLPLDLPLSETDEFLEKVWREIPSPDVVNMQFDFLWLEFGSAIGLKPATAKDFKIIQNWRNLVSEKTGIRFPNHDCYRFHISLSYGIVTPTKEQNLELEKEKLRFDEDCIKNPFIFRIPNPSLTFFKDMFYFDIKRFDRTLIK